MSAAETHSPDASKVEPPKHDRPSMPAHQFDDVAQQHDAEEFGMWLFLATEILFFGGLFLAYGLYRLHDEEAFIKASHHLNIWIGSINTSVLLGSSLTMALAVHAAETSNRKRLLLYLAATMLLGTVFLGVKAYEYSEKFQPVEPGSRYCLVPMVGMMDPKMPPLEQMFFFLYFVMTGLHAFHMVIGIGIMKILWWKAYRGAYMGDYSSPVHVTGLYWHFVDIVWVFLFPLLYLVGVH